MPIIKCNMCGGALNIKYAEKRRRRETHHV